MADGRENPAEPAAAAARQLYVSRLRLRLPSMFAIQLIHIDNNKKKNKGDKYLEPIYEYIVSYFVFISRSFTSFFSHTPGLVQLQQLQQHTPYTPYLCPFLFLFSPPFLSFLLNLNSSPHAFM